MNRLIDTVAKTVEADGYCAYTDADNDQIFEKCDFLSWVIRTERTKS